MTDSSSPIRREFLDRFGATSKRLGIDDSSLEAGREAVGEIFDKAVEVLAFAPAVMPYFAGHDIQHPMRLARIVEEFIAQNKPSVNSALYRVDCLVLLFASLLLHDAGMALLGDAEAEDYEEIWSAHLVRPKHDEMSLWFIESRLIASFESLHAWCAFWKAQPHSPKPFGKWQLYLLARICQSHGDPSDRWLQPTSLDSYHPQTPECAADLAGKGFRPIFGNPWEELRKSALGAATILSLVDLCDICPERFPKPTEHKLLEKILPQDCQARRTSMLHWIGHRVGRVSISTKTINYEVQASQRNELRMRSAISSGPGADLLRWANDCTLRRALNDFAGTPVTRVSFSLGPVDEEAWQEVEEEAANPVFQNTWPYFDLNKVLHGSAPLDFAIVVPRWWDSVAQDLFGSSDEEERIFPFHFLTELRGSGLLIEDCASPDSVAEVRDASMAVVYIPRRGIASQAWYLGDSFVAAVRLAREWMIDDFNLRHLRLAFKGNAVHRDLRRGKVEKYEGSVILVLVARSGSGVLGEYTQIAENITQAGLGSLRVIFFGGDECSAVELMKSNVRRVEFTIDYRRLEMLREQDDQKNEGGIVNPTEEEVSPTEALFLFYFRNRKGSDIFLEKLAEMLESRDSIHQALGVVLFLVLYELLDFTQTGVSESKLSAEYEEMQRAVANRFEIPMLASIRNLIGATRLLSFANGSVVAEEPRDAVGIVLSQVSKESLLAFLVQLASIFKFKAANEIYNVGSPIFSESLPAVYTDAAVDMVFDKTTLLRVKTTVGFGLAERLVARPDRTELNRLINSIALRAGDLRSFGDFVGFQMMYRIARGLWVRSRLQDEVEYLFSLNSRIVDLGMLEALASETSSKTESPQQSDEALVARIFSKFLGVLQMEVRVPTVSLMAYDIFWFYRHSSPLLRAGHPFLDLGQQLDWPAVAGLLHGDSDSSPAGTDLKKLLRRWKAMRRTFLDVLKATPVAMQREKVADLLRERVT